MRFSAAKRMYVYLQKKRGKEKKSTWKERLINFAERMGTSAKVARNIKHNLKNPLDELKAKGYMYDYQIAREGNHNEKEEFITFYFVDPNKLLKVKIRDGITLNLSILRPLISFWTL